MPSIYGWNLLVPLTEKFRVELSSSKTGFRASQDVLDAASRSVAGFRFFVFGFICWTASVALAAPGFCGLHSA